MVPFIGGSYSLEFRKADVQRSVNLFPSVIESGTGKASAVLNSIPGMTLVADLGAEGRGLHEVDGRLLAVAGTGLYEVSSAGVSTPRGTLATSTGLVDMAHGLFQGVIVDGPNGYVLTLQSNAFTQISSTGWRGSVRVGFLDGYFLFIAPDSQQFYWSAIDAADSLNALDFASAESNPDNLTALLVDHRDLMLFGAKTVEGWRNTGSTRVFERNEGAVMELGCAAPFTAQKLDSTFFWLGSDENGQGVVWMAEGYRPRRISNLAVEQQIQAAGGLSGAWAYTYQQDGHSFYCLNVPGLETTLCFDVATGVWHDRAELDEGGDFQPIRGVCHAFCHGRHYILADDGKLYYLDKTKNTLNGDVLVRERISPHEPKPLGQHQFFDKFTLNCDVGSGKPDGTAPMLQFRFSNDGGKTWSAYRTASLGAQGEYQTQPVFRRLGYVRRGGDRVWAVRCTDDTPFSIVEGTAE